VNEPMEVMVGTTAEMIRNYGWFLAFGIILLALGIAVVVRAFTGKAALVFLGWLMMFAGITEFVSTFMVGKWAGFFVHLLLALAFGTTGALIVFRPVISAEAVTFIMAVFLLVAGLYEFGVSGWTHLPGWSWQAANGAISTIMGLLLLTQWPIAGLWVVGLFVGIDLISYGSGWIALAIQVHKL